jgi:hypothetical protein
MTIALDDEIGPPFDDEEKRCRAEAIERAKAGFEEARIARLKALDRSAPIGLLGIAGLLPVKRQQRRRGRPKTPDPTLKSDDLAQAVLYATALNPEGKREAIVEQIAQHLNASRASIFEALQKLDPDRRANIEAAARAFAEWYYERHFPPKT